MTTARDRCAGVLWGLAAGDKNGGPIRMAVILSETLMRSKSFSKADVVASYQGWYQGKDDEPCFDTGQTFSNVFAKMHQVFLIYAF